MIRHTLRRLWILVAAFTILTVLVGTGTTDTLDAAVLGWIVPLRSALLDQVFQAVTLLGDPVVSSLLAIALTFWLVTRDGRRGQVALLFFAGLALEFVLKQVVFQPGPPSELVRDAVLLPGLRELSPYTYPGGHVMRVTFLAALVGARSARLRPVLWVIVVAVAVGRIYLATGWAADIVGGLLVGLVLASIAELIDARAGAAPTVEALASTPAR